MSVDFKPVVRTAFDKYIALDKERELIEVEQDKLRQFIFAAVNLLSDQDRGEFNQWVFEAVTAEQTQQKTLAEAICEVLFDNPKEWFTVSDLRDKLHGAGFDLSKYANALASISTTAKRLVPEDAETHAADGARAYRAKNTKAARDRDAKRREFKLYRSVFGETLTDAEIQAMIGDAMNTETFALPLVGDEPEPEEEEF